MAAALGDAVAVTWEGVGHTAFPVTTCLDGLSSTTSSTASFRTTGVSCPFVDGTSTDAEIGDHLFDYQSWWVRPWLEDVFVAEGAAEARCLARELSGVDHRVLTHLLLGVAVRRRRRRPRRRRAGLLTRSVLRSGPIGPIPKDERRSGDA